MRRRSRSRKPLAAVLALVLLPIALLPIAAHADPSSPLSDPASTAWASVRDADRAQLARHLTAYRANGYLPVDLDIDTANGRYRAAAVFQRNTDSLDWRVLRDLDGTRFGMESHRLRAAGLRLVDQQSYLLDGARRYAGVFVENAGDLDWTSRRDLSLADARRMHEQERGSRIPVDVDVYGSRPSYALVWADNAEQVPWRLHLGLTGEEYRATFERYRGTFRLLTVDSVRTPAGQRYAAIWVENTGDRAWAAHRDLTAQGFVNWWRRYFDEGYRLTGLNRYDTADGVRYAGTWRQNSDRPRWALKQAVDQRVRHELDSTGVPGISVAVMQGGTLRYLRGFGHADVGKDVWMDGTVSGPYNSVSKAIAGALTFDLIESGGGRLQLGERTRDHLPGLPAHHTHTVGQLLNLRGCVGHYGQIPAATFTDGPYRTARASVAEFADVPLVCQPGKDWRYSTHSYSVLGWVLEEYTGKPIGRLVSDWARRYGLTSIRPVDPADRGVRRMTLYTAKNTAMTPHDYSYKVLGGGLEGSVLDMARFGSLVLDGTILRKASLDHMVTPPDRLDRYAYGWGTGTDRGLRFADKDGRWAGSRTYLRVYPEARLVVAVLTNRDGGGHDPVLLGRDIAGMVLDEQGRR